MQTQKELDISSMINKTQLEGQLQVYVVHAKDLLKANGKSLSDPYTKLKFPNGKTKTTRKINYTLNPNWKEFITSG